MKYRDVGWWLSAIILSILLHGLLFTTFGKLNLPAAEVQPSTAEPLRVRLTFLQPEPVPQPVPETAPEPEPVPEPESEPEPEPLPEPKLQPRSEPQPRPKLEPKTERKPKAKVTPRAAPPQPPPPSSTPEPKSGPANAVELKQRYLASLLAKIEAHKTYSGAARRRAIQGNVDVSFQVGCDGSVSELNMPNGHKLLKSSAVQALKSAQPFPRPPPGIECPVPVSYAMAFELR